MRRVRTFRACVILVATIAICASVATAAGPRKVDMPIGWRIAAAEKRGIAFLLGTIGKDGGCKGEVDSKNHLYGQKTAICVYALLSAGVDYKQADVQRALRWLTAAKLTGVHAVSMRACALASVRDDRLLPTLRADVEWLERAAASNGAYTHTSLDGKAAAEYDNSSAYLALLGVWAGSRRGIEVHQQYWQMVEQFWIDQQQPDGGWGYFARPAPHQTKTYGSMTAAGLASLMICAENLGSEQFVRCTSSPQSKPITEALGWLAKNYRPDENPRMGDRFLQWLYALERAGLASGYKHFGGHDWYAKGAVELLSRQNGDGSWDYADQRVEQTSLALLFLARGRDSVMMSKLSYGGKWNCRPRDLANLSRWLSYTSERQLKWQVVGVDSPMQDWHDSPILYISGAGAVDFSDEQVAKLRLFVQQGGTIVSESACNSGDFTLDMGRLYKRMFPQYALERLSDEHPIYTIQYNRPELGGLLAVSNGVRLLAIHCPRELSLPLQLGPGGPNIRWFELANNIFYFVTDKGDLRPYGSSAWPAPETFKPRATIRVTRLKFKGNYDPEPMAWQRLALMMGKEQRIKVEIGLPIDIASLDARKHPLAILSGTGAFTLGDDEKAALKKYLASGGRVLIEAAGGSKEFAASAREQVLKLVPAAVRLNSAHAIFTTPSRINRITYRPDFAMTLGTFKNDPRIEAGMLDDKVVILLSAEDLTCGLLGTRVYKLRGYSEQTAMAIATNALCFLAGVE